MIQVEKFQKTLKKFPFLWNNFKKFIREIEKELGKLFHLFRKSRFHKIVEKVPKRVIKFSFLWKNFQNFIREIEQELGKISQFLGEVYSIIKMEKTPKNKENSVFLEWFLFHEIFLKFMKYFHFYRKIYASYKDSGKISYHIVTTILYSVC